MAADHHFDGRSLVWDVGRASLPKVGKDRDPSLTGTVPDFRRRRGEWWPYNGAQ